MRKKCKLRVKARQENNSRKGKTVMNRLRAAVEIKTDYENLLIFHTPSIMPGIFMSPYKNGQMGHIACCLGLFFKQIPQKC